MLGNSRMPVMETVEMVVVFKEAMEMEKVEMGMAAVMEMAMEKALEMGTHIVMVMEMVMEMVILMVWKQRKMPKMRMKDLRIAIARGARNRLRVA